MRAPRVLKPFQRSPQDFPNIRPAGAKLNAPFVGYGKALPRGVCQKLGANMAGVGINSPQ